jgi:flagellar assembly protein FliH
MILRDAIFSVERRHLGAQPAAEPPARTERVDSPVEMHAEVHNEIRESAAGYEVRPAEVQPLSSDRVASWLVTQDGATRTALASLLSEELAGVRDAAHTEGYERGHAEAMKEAREKVRGALAALETLHAAAEEAFSTDAAQITEACADIVGEAFFKLAGSALLEREAVVGVVTEVLKRVRDERELRIHVNPQDLPLLRSAEAGIAASLPGRRFTLLADARVETGGCIVESSLGSLDGRLEVQLAGLCASLRAARQGGAA